jgi:hypothetical protein
MIIHTRKGIVRYKKILDVLDNKKQKGVCSYTAPFICDAEKYFKYIESVGQTSK